MLRSPHHNRVTGSAHPSRSVCTINPHARSAVYSCTGSRSPRRGGVVHGCHQPHTSSMSNENDRCADPRVAPRSSKTLTRIFLRAGSGPFAALSFSFPSPLLRNRLSTLPQARQASRTPQGQKVICVRSRPTSRNTACPQIPTGPSGAGA